MAQAGMPNFLLIGAPKSGTTSLYHYLKQHPDIFMSPVKEPSFFAIVKNGIPITKEEKDFIFFHSNGFRDGVLQDSFKGYQALFSRAGDAKAIGEASTMYWISSLAPRCIQHYVPDARLLAILRDPAERAYSAYQMRRRQGREPFETFDETLCHTNFLNPRLAFKTAEHPRYVHYLQGGHYHGILTRYLEMFPRERLRVYLFQDFITAPMTVLKDVFSFLEVDATFKPDIGITHNTARVPSARNPAVRAFEAAVSPRVRAAARALTPLALRYRYDRMRGSQLESRCPPEARRRLVAYYRDDMLRLQDLIGRDLQSWFAVPSNGGVG